MLAAVTKERTALKVGELAKRTGLSVRTLHYYDEIGLLSPSQHTASGHRLYGARDVMRLQQIKSLRQLGFSLEEVRECLERPEWSPAVTIERHVARLREQIEHQQRLCALLESLGASLSFTDDVSVDSFILAVRGITMMEKYFTPEQTEAIRERGERIGKARIREVEAAWPQLIGEVKAEMERGTDPADPRVQALARRWKALLDEFTGGDAATERALNAMYHAEPEARERTGIPPEMFAYVGKAMRAAGVPLPGGR